MRAGFGRHSGTLKRSGEAVLGRSVQRAQLDRLLKFLNRLGVVLQCKFDGGDVVVGVRVGGIELRGALEVAKSLLLVAGFKACQAQAVPYAWVRRSRRGQGLKRRICFRQAAELNEGQPM